MNFNSYYDLTQAKGAVKEQHTAAMRIGDCYELLGNFSRAIV